MSDTLVIPPDAEKLLIDFLLAQAEVEAIVADRIYSALPASERTWPAMRVVLIDRVPDYDVPLHHETAMLQVDVWGGPKATARRAADTARAAIAARISTHPHAEAVVQNATFRGPRWAPDATTNPSGPARPRYVFDVDLRLRPHTPPTS